MICSRSPTGTKSPNDWGSWSPTTEGDSPSASGKSLTRKTKKKSGTKEGLLIDFAEEKQSGDWNSKWDDEAWEMLNKKD